MIQAPVPPPESEKIDPDKVDWPSGKSGAAEPEPTLEEKVEANKAKRRLNVSVGLAEDSNLPWPGADAQAAVQGRQYNAAINVAYKFAAEAVRDHSDPKQLFAQILKAEGETGPLDPDLLLAWFDTVTERDDYGAGLPKYTCQQMDLFVLVKMEWNRRNNVLPLDKGCVWSHRVPQELYVAQLEIACLDDVTEEDIDWLWPGRFARKSLSMIFGKAEKGKSLVIHDIAARVSSGTKWPDQDAHAPEGKVLYLSSEEEEASVLKPRLRVARANMKNIYVLRGSHTPISGKTLSFKLADDLDPLREFFRTHPGFVMLVIDPIMSYMGDRSGDKAYDVRGMLEPLNRLAADFRLAIIMLNHLNKSDTITDAVDRSLGSGAFQQIARATWMVDEDPEDDSKRYFLRGKSNIANKPDGLAFKIIDAPHESRNIPKIEWLTDPVELSASQWLAGKGEAGKPGAKLAKAKEFLGHELACGPLPMKYLEALAAEQDIAWETLKRASEAMEVEKQRLPATGYSGWVWMLADHWKDGKLVAPIGAGFHTAVTLLHKGANMEDKDGNAVGVTGLVMAEEAKKATGGTDQSAGASAAQQAASGEEVQAGEAP